jgi:hypothetical protein
MEHLGKFLWIRATEIFIPEEEFQLLAANYAINIRKFGHVWQVIEYPTQSVLNQLIEAACTLPYDAAQQADLDEDL